MGRLMLTLKLFFRNILILKVMHFGVTETSVSVHFYGHFFYRSDMQKIERKDTLFSENHRMRDKQHELNILSKKLTYDDH